jgi:hypothetical protein
MTVMTVFPLVIGNNSNKSSRDAYVHDDSDASNVHYKHADTICENHPVEIFYVPLQDSAPTLI